MSSTSAGAGQSHGATNFDPEALALAHKAKGFCAAYAPNIKLHETELIKATKEAFARHDIMIAEAGYWENLLDLDADTKKFHHDAMLETFQLAEELGAKCAVNILGSFCTGNGNSAFSPRNFADEAFEAAVEIARYFIDTVKPKTACFAYEIFPFNIVDSPEMIYKLIKAVDRDMFAVHLDLANLINSPRNYWRSGEIMKECVQLFGNRIVAAHVKDIKMQEPAISVILEEVIPGQGMLDHATYIRELHALPQDIPFMMEHLASEAEYDQAAAHLRAVGAEQGIMF